MNGSSDEEQLAFATGNAWIIVTANVGHFAGLHRAWARDGKPHAGILIRSQKVGVGENARRIESAILRFGEQIDNDIVYLSASL